LSPRASANSELGTRLTSPKTYEEANRAYGNWIRQRSRWIKGYMQTFLVNMRAPHRLARTIGWKAFAGFILFIGGTPFVFLVNPILYLLTLAWLITGNDFVGRVMPPWLIWVSGANFLLGNFLSIYVYIMGVFRRENYPMAPYALLNPLYWCMHAIASYKGLWQLLVKPFYWEKTEHGLTTMRVNIPGHSAK
jgi:glycosyltransferase XagB